MKDFNSGSTKIIHGQFSDVYEVSTEIGRGKFAVVKRCTHKSSGTEYAAKFLKKRRKGRDCRKDVLYEVHMLEMALSHPHIISLVEVYETINDLIIVTHFASGGELFEYINTEGQLEEKMTVRLMHQILDGISFLHRNSIAHLDVKPQNILLTESLPKGDIKLCDFGLARLINCGHDILEIIGTPDYVAPEVLDYKPLNSACDLWSVGVLTYVMLTGCSPFAGDTIQETYLNISQVNLEFPEELFQKISEDAIDFIKSLLLKNPLDRMSARQSLDHVWLRKRESAESPLGQRRTVLSMQNPDFHKPVKKSKCDQKPGKENQIDPPTTEESVADPSSIPVSNSSNDFHTKINSCLSAELNPLSSDSIEHSSILCSKSVNVTFCDDHLLPVEQLLVGQKKESLELIERQDLPEVFV